MTRKSATASFSHSHPAKPIELSIGTSASAAIAPLLLNLAQAARLLGLSDRTVWTLTTNGTLPHVRIGRRVLYPFDRLQAWVTARIKGGTDAAAATRTADAASSR